MELDDPVFRKIIIPWYDSDSVCLIMIIFMFMVFIFGIFGLSAAYEKIEYNGLMWIPAALVIMSSCIIISVVIRVVLRNSPRKRSRRRP